MIFVRAAWLLLLSLLILKRDLRSSGSVLSLHMEHSLSSEWLELNVLKMDELLHKMWGKAA